MKRKKSCNDPPSSSSSKKKCNHTSSIDPTSTNPTSFSPVDPTVNHPPSSSNPNPSSSNPICNEDISFFNKNCKQWYENFFNYRPLLLERFVLIDQLKEEGCNVIFSLHQWNSAIDIKKTDKAYNTLVKIFYSNMHDIDRDDHKFKSLVRNTSFEITPELVSKILGVRRPFIPNNTLTYPFKNFKDISKLKDVHAKIKAGVPNSFTIGVPNSSTAGVPNSFTIGVPNSSKAGLPPDPLQIYGMLLVVSALRWQVFMIRPKREDGILVKVMLQDLKIVCPLSVVTSVKWIKWESLPLNMVKMNMDGASKGSSGLSGGGCNASSWKNAITPGSGRMRCAIIRNGDEFCRMLNSYAIKTGFGPLEGLKPVYVIYSFRLGISAHFELLKG
ncbi:unnamed protein product [Ilex paraguariensis]|uniref:Uncharacterized protein n=1 Tax=Ilex paraguariensis TaxID=185542 RepID=A0ABC8TJF9_9AQUA